MVKRNIEEKIKKNELAKKREQEISRRKFSYFKESNEELALIKDAYSSLNKIIEEAK